MIGETILLLDRWLKHPEFGVSALLPELPRQTPEGETDPMPQMPDIFNELECAEVAMGDDPPSNCALVVFAVSDAPVADVNASRQITRKLVVGIGYTTRDAAPLVAAKESGYVLRAAKQCLTRLNSQSNSSGYRELNAVKIASVENITIQRTAGGVGKSRLWGFVLASVTVIDQKP